jgi:hypothetical protein
MKNAQYKFPDEVDDDTGDEFEIEIQDDVPAPDRNAEPLPKELAEELEGADNSEDYSTNVKLKFKQYKKAWHDERREKEQAFREQEEALTMAQKLLDDNKRLKTLLESGEKELINTYQTSAELEVSQARRNYKEAYDYGDTDKIVAAQEELMKATNKLDKANNFRPTISNVEIDVQLPQKQPQQAVQVDPKVAEWVAENQWYVDPTKKPMRKFAVGVHDDLFEKYGADFVGTDKYFEHINKEVAKRFPEEFEEPPEQNDEKPQRTPRLSTVVAPATRSTASRKVVLTKTQVALAKKFGLTPEQYARELTKLEA